MNEALMSALPVFMTNISPNNHVLPSEWLVKTRLIETFRTKVRIELFEADALALAEAIDGYVSSDNKVIQKEKAFELGYNNFSPDKLKDSYLNIISHI
jgi:hypothetical protein